MRRFLVTGLAGLFVLCAVVGCGSDDSMPSAPKMELPPKGSAPGGPQAKHNAAD